MFTKTTSFDRHRIDEMAIALYRTAHGAAADLPLSYARRVAGTTTGKDAELGLSRLGERIVNETRCGAMAEGNVIDQFMWQWQQHFRISVEVLAEMSLEKIGARLDPQVILIGLARDTEATRSASNRRQDRFALNTCQTSKPAPPIPTRRIQIAGSGTPTPGCTNNATVICGER